LPPPAPSAAIPPPPNPSPLPSPSLGACAFARVKAKRAALRSGGLGESARVFEKKKNGMVNQLGLTKR
jgi:hypothetical protein